jgi:hypothetical protein
MRPVPVPAGGRSPDAGKTQKRVAIIAGVVALLVVVVIGMAANAHSGPHAPPDEVQLYYLYYEAGDCLSGDFPNTGGGTWPDPAWEVPCYQGHTDEVFYANDTFWQASASYPGDAAVSEQAMGQCETQLLRYVDSQTGGTMYAYTHLEPDAQTWQDGDRKLVCVAYYPTAANPTGEVLRKSIMDSKQ